MSFEELLKSYFGVYYLKPFDAVNDAANAFSMQKFAWEAPLCEIGTGDGMFSFFLHGGKLRLEDDRYSQCNTKLSGDIYNTYDKAVPPKVLTPAARKFAFGIDGNPVHLTKCKDFGHYETLVESPAEQFSKVPTGSMQTVFFYVYHGLKDYEGALKEAVRVLREHGELYLLAYSDSVRDAFPCHTLSQLPGKQGEYFSKLDNGRRDELCSYAKSLKEWEQCFSNVGLKVEEVQTQVSPLAWKFYDVQTRPFLKALIEWDQDLAKQGLKTGMKKAWMDHLFPPLLQFAEQFALPRQLKGATDTPDVFLTFRLKKGKL